MFIMVIIYFYFCMGFKFFFVVYIFFELVNNWILVWIFIIMVFSSKFNKLKENDDKIRY